MSFCEFFLFLKTLTTKKIFNFLLREVMKFWAFSKKKIKFLGVPWSVSVEPCNICNLKCKQCPSGLGLLKRERTNIKISDFCQVVDQIYSTTLNLFLYFQGEPFVNKHFIEMVKYAKQKNIYTVTSSNGHFIDMDTAEKTVLSGLDKIIISLDGYNQQTYEVYRKGGNFSVVLKAIENLSVAKKKLHKKNPIIEVQTLATSYNENNLKKIKKMAFLLGADKFAIKTMQIEVGDYEFFLPKNNKLSRYEKKTDGTYQLKRKVKFCSRVFDSAVVSSKLDVVPCCYDKDTNFVLGNISQKSFNEIVKGKKTLEFLTLILSKKRPNICENCVG